MISRFVKLYTPFICSLISAIHGVLLLLKVNTSFYWIASSLTGHSILLVLFMIIHSKRMCKWYKMTLYSMLSIHVLNLLTRLKIIERCDNIKISIVISVFAIITWLIFRVTYKTAKVIHSACKHSEIE